MDAPRDAAGRPHPVSSPSVQGRARPFGAHLRMSWWKPLVVIIVPSLVMVVLQVALYQIVGVIEGSDDPLAAGFTPLKFLAVNLSVGAAGVLAIVLLAWMAEVPWRSLISAPRAFDARRLAEYLLGAALLVGAGIGVVALVAPDAPGWTAFGVSATTVAMLVIILLTTPIQAAGEELMFRSAVLPAAASWVRAVRPALVVGLVVSSLAFAVVHGSTDPWLFGYYVVIGVCTGLMAIISGGVEAPIAFHVANNVLATTVNTLMADGEAFPLDRSTDTGDASLLILAAVDVGMVVLVWVRERRARAAGRAGDS
ncbi:CPBP family intramembrane glutamic endopeptidase [Herbidospora mongoliensis]|uniref:CPBP family intramembrane glutamic endopeptidase n=1 Tax=Herbidospora mongoliensis TaxID=688067 RepID=UPI000B0FAC7E|nr:type II CAAX endopeptidase family protein [Herbidospora mongoliensis]